MSTLTTRVEQDPDGKIRVMLGGSLDTNTAPQFKTTMDEVLKRPPEFLVLDMQDLGYISSAGIREVFRVVKTVRGKGGVAAMAKLQPSIRKVFDIINALPDIHIFASYDEMDEYLDHMQRQTPRE